MSPLGVGRLGSCRLPPRSPLSRPDHEALATTPSVSIASMALVTSCGEGKESYDVHSPVESRTTSSRASSRVRRSGSGHELRGFFQSPNVIHQPFEEDLRRDRGLRSISAALTRGHYCYASGEEQNTIRPEFTLKCNLWGLPMKRGGSRVPATLRVFTVVSRVFLEAHCLQVQQQPRNVSPPCSATSSCTAGEGADRSRWRSARTQSDEGEHSLGSHRRGPTTNPASTIIHNLWGLSPAHLYKAGRLKAVTDRMVATHSNYAFELSPLQVQRLQIPECATFVSSSSVSTAHMSFNLVRYSVTADSS